MVVCALPDVAEGVSLRVALSWLATPVTGCWPFAAILTVTTEVLVPSAMSVVGVAVVEACQTEAS